MIVFQDEPDAIFLSIVHEALAHARDVHLLRYRQGHRPTTAERRELDESYGDLFPELVLASAPGSWGGLLRRPACESGR